MSARISVALFAILGFTLSAQPVAAQQMTDKELAARVRKAIDKGVAYLKASQGRNGSWDHHGLGLDRWDAGLSCLAMLALLECGVDPNDDVIRKGLDYLRKMEPRSTYVVSLQTMVFSRGQPEKDQLLIQRNVDWLRKTLRRDANRRAAGWGYGEGIGGPEGADNSNSQYAVLALWMASQAGASIDKDLWRDIEEYYLRNQAQDGGWPYSSQLLRPPGGSSVTMTAAGVSGLLITGMELNKDREKINADGTIENCGKIAPNDALARGLTHLGSVFTVNARPWQFYNLYGLERAGRLSGQRFFVGRGARQQYDWYRMGARFLVAEGSPGQQLAEGSWKTDSPIDGNQIIATSFALLFLSKGRTPVLIHKMVHGRDATARSLSGDWNNDRDDVRNLTDYAQREVFQKKVPLTWQAFNAQSLDPENPEHVAEMLAAPILYINGHNAPAFTPSEKELLKRYVDQGGFILAEACCSRREFADGFRALARDLWPDRKLEPLADGHPIWTAFARVDPTDAKFPYKLEGLDFGCKTPVILSPQDLSCYWQSNNHKGEGPVGARAKLAFRLGGNIIAYATGLEPPMEKGEFDSRNVATDVKPPRRGYLQVAQLNYGGPNWQPAPKAMRNLMNHMREKWNIDVVLEETLPDGRKQTKPLRLTDASLPYFKFLYMHGRGNFTIEPQHGEILVKHLKHGGILLADAACGNGPFDESFRKFIQQTFNRDLEPIPMSDPLFSDRIGKGIKTVQGRTRAGAPYGQMQPQFEGIRLDPKNPKSPWIVIYSKYDLGCSLDRHASPDCLGYNYESALDLAAQVVLYAVKE